MSTPVSNLLPLSPRKISRKAATKRDGGDVVVVRKLERRKSPTRVKSLQTENSIRKKPESYDSNKEISPRRWRPSRQQVAASSDVVLPKLYNDQIVSMRNLLNEDTGSADKQLKKMTKTKTTRVLQDQMENRAVLNMQFNSIRKLMMESELSNSAQDTQESEVPEVDGFCNPSLIWANAVGTDRQSSKGLERLASHTFVATSTEVNREMSFRDIMTRKRDDQKSFKDLAKMKAVDVFRYEQDRRKQAAKSYLVTIEDEDENFMVGENEKQALLSLETVLCEMSDSIILEAGQSSNCKMDYSTTETSVDSCSGNGIFAKREIDCRVVSPMKDLENLQSRKASQFRTRPVSTGIADKPKNKSTIGRHPLLETTRKRNDHGRSCEFDFNLGSPKNAAKGKQQTRGSLKLTFQKGGKERGSNCKAEIAETDVTLEYSSAKESRSMEKFSDFDFDPQKTPSINDVQKLRIFGGEHVLKSQSSAPSLAANVCTKERSQIEGAFQGVMIKNDSKQEQKKSVYHVLETTNHIFVDY